MVLLFLVGGEKVFIPCENVAEDKENHFEIAPEDYIAVSEKGEICGIGPLTPTRRAKTLSIGLTNATLQPIRFLVGV